MLGIRILDCLEILYRMVYEYQKECFQYFICALRASYLQFDMSKNMTSAIYLCVISTSSDALTRFYSIIYSLEKPSKHKVI